MRASSNRPLDWSGRPQQSCLGTIDLEAVVLEDRHDLLPLPRLVVLGAAAVEVDDLAPGGRARVVLEPAREAPARRTWEPPRRDGYLAVFCPRTRSGRKPIVKLASGATGVPARPSQVGRVMIRSRSGTPFWLLELVARLRVDLGDLHPLRAGHRADPAAGAIVDRRVDRRLVGDPVALGLRTGVLRPREQRRARSRPGTASRRSCT